MEKEDRIHSIHSSFSIHGSAQRRRFLTVRIYVGHVSLHVVKSGGNRGDHHDSHADISRDVIFRAEGEDHGLEKDNDRSNHLGNGFELAEHACRNHDAALSRNHEAQTGNAELAQKEDQNNGGENKAHRNLALDQDERENGDQRAEHHEFIRQGIDKLSEIGHEIVFSGDLAI